ncbi:MAG: hypothetical protein HUJ80_03110 [Firmicutes bacterium]|nr:hypothetical protein [Bacillota bacterium]
MSDRYLPLVPLLLGTLLCTGISLLFLQDPRKLPLKEVLRTGSDADILLRQSGLGISAGTYYAVLLLLCAGLSAWGFLKTLLCQSPGSLLLGLLAAFYLWFLLRPSLFLYGKVRSPFAFLLQHLAAARRKRMDRGLYSSCVVLKNLAIVGRSAPLSADRILEKLAGCAHAELKPVYHTLLALVRTGNADEGFHYFAEAIGTPTARVFAGLLSKLDQINPAELQEQVQALIDAISEKRVTEGYLQAQRNGAVTMTLATVSVTLAMLDFLVVVVYMDLIEMLTTLW